MGIVRHYSDEQGGSFKIDYATRQLDDLDALRMPHHVIDEAATCENHARIQDAVGDIFPVNLNRGPAYIMWTCDIATELGYLRGIEDFMLDMMAHPEWMHRFVRFIVDDILCVHDETEAAVDRGLCDHQNQAMPYARELPDPAVNRYGVRRLKRISARGGCHKHKEVGDERWGIRWALIIIGVSGAHVMQIYILRNFIEDIPRDLFDAAAVDGAGPFIQVRTIVVSMSGAILSVLAILQFFGVWNNFILPFIVIRDDSMLTLAACLVKLDAEYVKQWGEMMAGYSIALLPLVIIFRFTMRFFVKGIAAVAIKG